MFEKAAREEGHPVIGWRDVPTDNSSLGKSSKASEPFLRHVFIKFGVRRRGELISRLLRHEADGEERNQGVGLLLEDQLPSFS